MVIKAGELQLILIVATKSYKAWTATLTTGMEKKIGPALKILVHCYDSIPTFHLYSHAFAIINDVTLFKIKAKLIIVNKYRSSS